MVAAGRGSASRGVAVRAPAFVEQVHAQLAGRRCTHSELNSHGAIGSERYHHRCCRHIHQCHLVALPPPKRGKSLAPTAE
jgi:hypothetical protein